jgi:alpha-ribazole phosphatase
MKLALIRHGAAGGTVGRCIGRTDVALSRAGVMSIQRLAAAWYTEGDAGVLPPPTRILSSDLARARVSAGGLAAELRLPVELDPRLREVDFGTWDGRSWVDIEREEGAHLAAWMEHWVSARPPAGESFSDLRRRVGHWYQELGGQPGTAENGTIAVVTHAGVIRALLCNLLRWSAPWAFRVSISPASVTGMLDEGGQVELLFLNSERVPKTSG